MMMKSSEMYWQQISPDYDHFTVNELSVSLTLSQRYPTSCSPAPRSLASSDKESHHSVTKTSQLTESQRESCHFSVLSVHTQQVTRGHSLTFYPLTCRHLVIGSAHRLGGQLTSVNTEVITGSLDAHSLLLASSLSQRTL